MTNGPNPPGLHAALADHLADIAKLFTPGAKLTLVVRNPQVEGDAGVVVGDDDLTLAVGEIRRRQGHDEGKAAIFRRQTEAGTVDGTRESLASCVRMIDTYTPDLFPANEHGQVAFARAMLESTAAEIKAYLASTETRDPSKE